MSKFGRVMGLGLAMSLTACGTGRSPETISDCPGGTKSGIELIVDDPNPLNNPEDLLGYADYKNKNDPTTLEKGSDPIDGLGELACKSVENGLIKLYLLDDVVGVRDDFAEELEKEANSPDQLLEDIRQQQATSTTTTTTLG